MGSSYRARGCICFSKSWRTACSCLQSPRLMLVLIIIYVLHCSQSQAKYIHDTGTAYTFSCNSSWCGERWKANRILRYTYNLTDKLVVKKLVHVVHENNCSGTQDSSECYSHRTTKNETRPVRVITLQRNPVPRITAFPAMNLYLITTDNINESSSISNKYYPNQDKIWQLRIPKGCKMTVYFSQFDLQVSGRCSNDSFSVQTSRDQQDIYRYCNDLHKIEIKRKKRVQMTFHADSAVEQGGIKATVCLSNLQDAVSDNEFNQRFPCTCNLKSSSRRRRKVSNKSSFLRQRIVEEDIKVARWLNTLMLGGKDAVEEILRAPESLKQRHLAEQYQAVLSKHREW